MISLGPWFLICGEGQDTHRYIPGVPRDEPCTAIRCPNSVCYLAGEAALNEYLRIKTVTFEY